MVSSGIRHSAGRCLLASLFLFIPLLAGAQIYSTGADPGNVRWQEKVSQNFRILFPAGMDSLATEYSLALEKFRLPVSLSIGYKPNQFYRKPMPVILKAFTASSNGAVTWAPRRMELFTVPEAYSPDPLPWITTLAVHEARHVAQMQVGRDRRFRIFPYLVGELADGAMAGLYGGPLFLEGDAVTAETALTSSGRGRTADFLEYYRVCADAGQNRGWFQWRWGSQKNYTPDHYAFGYLNIAGTRYLYDDALFSKRFYQNLYRSKYWIFPFNNFRRTVKDVSGKSFDETFNEIWEAFASGWEKDIISRAPFMPGERVSSQTRFYEAFTGNVFCGDELFSINSGIAQNRRIIKFSPSGKEIFTASFASSTSPLTYSPFLGRIFWSETVWDSRWEMRQFSEIHYFEKGDKKKHSLVKKVRWFNPSPSITDEKVAVSDYPLEGGSAIAIIDGLSGKVLDYFPAPDSIQVVESAWAGKMLVASGLSDGGFGLYDVKNDYRILLDPQPVKVKQLRSSRNSILFTCDLNGVNELYSFYPDSKKLLRLTNTRNGASDFAFDETGDTLFYSVPSPEGRVLYKTATGDLPIREVHFENHYRYPIADKLSFQESTLADQCARDYSAKATYSTRDYRKIPHIFRFHSWAPVYFDLDSYSNLNFDYSYSLASIGAVAFFQNDLSTANGSVGIAYHPDDTDRNSGRWRPSAHLRFNYSGLYPVIETSLDINGSSIKQYRSNMSEMASLYVVNLQRNMLDGPEVDAKVKVSVPFNLSSGGWSRGITPQIRYSVTNCRFNTSTVRMSGSSSFPSGRNFSVFDGCEQGPNILMQRLSASVRGYSMLPKAASGVFPRFGIGAEAGYSIRPGLGRFFSPNFYAYLYGYLPGLIPEHGLKFSTCLQTRLGDSFISEPYTSTVPRGFSEANSVMNYLSAQYKNQTLFSADYAMAILPVDWSFLGQVAYIRNFELTAHCDLGWMPAGNGHRSGTLLSAGIDLCANLANLLWLPYDTQIGVSWSWNGGSLFGAIASAGIPANRHYAGLIFSVNL